MYKTMFFICKIKTKSGFDVQLQCKERINNRNHIIVRIRITIQSELLANTSQHGRGAIVKTSYNIKTVVDLNIHTSRYTGRFIAFLCDVLSSLLEFCRAPIWVTY